VRTCKQAPRGTRLNWPGTRLYAGNAPGSRHAGWSRIGEGDCDRVWAAPFCLFVGQPVHVGVLRIGYWHYQKVGTQVTKSKTRRLGASMGLSGSEKVLEVGSGTGALSGHIAQELQARSQARQGQ